MNYSFMFSVFADKQQHNALSSPEFTLQYTYIVELLHFKLDIICSWNTSSSGACPLKNVLNGDLCCAVAEVFVYE